MFKYIKFLFQQFTSSKFVRKGKCNRCGSCCRNILLFTDKDLPVTTPEQFEKIKEWDKHFKNFYISGESETGALLFTCNAIDENNNCRVYFLRGIGCRLYPKVNSKFLINGGKPLKNCGYYFEASKNFSSFLKKK